LKIAIIGLGLLGTSLGMALRGRKEYRRLGWTRRAEVTEWALAHDVIDETGSLPEVLAAADLTVLCLPIPRIIEFLRVHAHEWKQGAVVTDIGSVKSCIETAAGEALAPHGVRFVGSHPMAGTEYSGPEAAFPTLYDNAETFICPGALSDDEAIDRVEALWRTVGTRPRRLGCAEHDQVVAHTSHISHLLASALTTTVLECATDEERQRHYSGCATGFRDTSRIASSSPEMWREIIEHNAPAVIDAARRFEANFRKLAETIEAGDFDAFEAAFAHGKALRDAWIAYKNEMKKSNRKPS